MAKKNFSVDIDLNKNYLLNFGIQVLAAPPSTPTGAQMYWDTTLGQLRVFNGSVWVDNTNVALSTLVTGSSPITVTPNGNGVIISIGAASGSAAGSMSAADFTKLLNATAASTSNTLAQRDSAGRLQVATPITAADAANKQYVDDLVSGKDWKDSVRAATTANITLSGLQTVDGITLVAGDRVLVKDQTTASANGIYIVSGAAWTRSVDANTNAQVTTGMTMLVEQGSINGSSGWSLNTVMPISLNTTALSFIKTLQSAVIIAGAGLLQTGNNFDLVAADGSLQVNPDSVQVRLVANGGIGVNAAGLFVTGYTPVAGTTVARKWASVATNVGGGTAVVFTHNLNSTEVVVDVCDATTKVKWEYDIASPTANTVTVTANGATQSVMVTVIA